MAYEEETHQEQEEEDLQLQKQRENDQFQHELDEIITRLENEQFQEELDEIIERLEHESHGYEEDISCPESKSEEELEQLDTLEKLSTTNSDNHNEEIIEEEQTQNQEFIEIEESLQDSIKSQKIDQTLLQEEEERPITEHLDHESQQSPPIEEEFSSHESVTDEESVSLKALEFSSQSSEDQLFFQHEEYKEKQQAQIQDFTETEQEEKENSQIFSNKMKEVESSKIIIPVYSQVGEDLQQLIDIKNAQTSIQEEKNEHNRIMDIEQGSNILMKNKGQEIVLSPITSKTEQFLRKNAKNQISSPREECLKSSFAEKEVILSDEIINRGMRVFTNPTHSNIDKFVNKWNEYIVNEGKLTVEMKKCFNQIVTRYDHDTVFRIAKKDNPVLLRCYHDYQDLTNSLRNQLSTNHGSRVIFGGWKEFNERNLFWKVKYGKRYYYVKKTTPIVGSENIAKIYWNSNMGGGIFFNMFFEKADINLSGETAENRAKRKMIKDQIPEYHGKSFRQKLCSLKNKKQIIDELMILVWNKKSAEADKPPVYDDSGYYQRYTVTRKPFALDKAMSSFKIFRGDSRSIGVCFKKYVEDKAKKPGVNAWIRDTETLDVSKFMKKVNASQITRELKKILLTKVSYEDVLITVKQAEQLGFDINIDSLWSSELELQKLGAATFKDFQIRRLLGYPIPSEIIYVNYGSMKKLLSNPDIITTFDTKKGGKIATEVCEIKPLESKYFRTRATAFLADLLLSKGYISRKEKKSIGKSMYLVKYDEPILSGTTVGKSIKGQTSAIVLIDHKESSFPRFAEIFNEVRLKYFGERSSPTIHTKAKIEKKLEEDHSKRYGLNLISVDDTSAQRTLYRLEEIAQRAGKSEQTFVYEVFLRILFESQDWN